MGKFLVAISVFFLALAVVQSGENLLAAEPYPVKPISYLIGLEAGSDGDVLARPICQEVSTILGKPLIIVNKPGAAGVIAYREIHSAKPDGYTLGFASASIVLNKLLGAHAFRPR